MAVESAVEQVGGATSAGGIAVDMFGAEPASSLDGALLQTPSQTMTSKALLSNSVLVPNGSLIAAPPGPFRMMLCLANLPCFSIADELLPTAKKTVRMLG